jgi:Response regulator of the LytR/AlgR family
MTEKIRVIIVDDEQKAVANLHHHLSKYCPQIIVVGTAHTIQEARTLISTQQFDVAFFDIQLFKENIFSLIDSLHTINFHIVFVTAFDNFAVKAFKVDALDYLLKPLDKDEIISCYKKIIKNIHLPTSGNISQPAISLPRKIIIRHSEIVYVVKQTDVYYLKAKGFYTEIYFYHELKIISVLISKPISTLEKEYDCPLFFRSHKSYIVNVQYVKHIHKTDTVDIQMNNDALIPVAKRRVSDFIRFINENRQ